MKYLAIGTLIPYINNAKQHEPAQIDQLAASIKEFGFNNPILVDGEKGVIAGHGRLLAAAKLDMKKVPTIDLSHLSDAQRKAYILADNRLAEVNTSWNFDLLSVELEGLKEDGFDIDLVGFDESFILDDEDEGLEDEDAAPALSADPVTAPGDVWVMGKHRLVCGDALSTDTMDALMQGEIASMVFTDPPGDAKVRDSRGKTAVDDPDDEDQLPDIVPTLEIYSSGWVFIWANWKALAKWTENTAAIGYPTNMVVWHKGGSGRGDLQKSFTTDYEMALVWNRGAPLAGRSIGSVWKVGKDSAENFAHPTQQPVELAVEAIDKTTRRGAMVLDVFGGSGSTLIACQKSGRICRMVEVSPAYCDVIVSRWQDYSGKKAALEDGGKTFDDLMAKRKPAKSAA